MYSSPGRRPAFRPAAGGAFSGCGSGSGRGSGSGLGSWSTAAAGGSGGLQRSGWRRPFWPRPPGSRRARPSASRAASTSATASEADRVWALVCPGIGTSVSVWWSRQEVPRPGRTPQGVRRRNPWFVQDRGRDPYLGGGTTSAVGPPMATTPTPTPTNPTTHPAGAGAGQAEPVPIALWPVTQATAAAQRAGRYLPASTAHPGKMLPALAARIVAEYSYPGDLVVDPMCGTGTTMVEAAILARRAVGLELEAKWAELSRANLAHALDSKARRLAEVRVGDATARPGPLADLAGRVDLVCTSPPYGCDAGIIDKPGWVAGGRLCPPESRDYSADPANLGHGRGEGYAASMAAVYSG